MAWNTLAPTPWRFDSAALGFIALTLVLSLQASYAAPLILLAQNRQDDRDRVQIEQDRQRAERNLADTEYLAREVVALRLAVRDMATKDFIRAELRALLEDLDRRDAAESGEQRRVPDRDPPDSRRPCERRWRAVLDPEIRQPITELDMVGAVSVDAAGTRPCRDQADDRRMPGRRHDRTRRARRHGRPCPASRGVDVDVSVMTPAERAALTEKLRGGRAAARRSSSARTR